MNIPNRLTLLRVLMAPVFLVVLMWDFPYHYAAACGVFALAALTDFIDGRIARKYKLVTNLGKFLDPLADKMLTTAAFLGFLAQERLDVWAVMIVLAREFLVTSVRLVSAGSGVVIAANFWGKAKTFLQMLSIGVMLLALEWECHAAALSPDSVFVPVLAAQIFIWVSVVLTAVSGAIYFWNYREFFIRDK
ncbi:MAG: CDP-diacylglycerol--glycerol-3-phosphate 3-phosphatidyltransferase [Ruminococcaceae bacterium]|nr:CDP-diacylglycerol--glycerol-3-phosphate 3-phosphatidyltransferase [Oscillospiraceae bacterium]MBQ2781300.1 CDP-diacylglycerol--glycerol-3-phosphate 3-phosphatidyltransferase [Clostridia bacterium]MBQ7302592.1 CDP-diacylglycerol--glycerol-3-phosphate 3-phosphatidyltransferase [Clostridia bacterium]